MTETSAPAEVVRADRELFIFLMGFDVVPNEGGFQRILNGEFDHWEKMQKIARHRLNTRPVASTLDPETDSDAIERLRIMAKQRPTSEMDDEDIERADWQGAYDWFCTESREILQALSPGKTGSAGVGEGTP
jgi:hypothetical protein